MLLWKLFNHMICAFHIEHLANKYNQPKTTSWHWYVCVWERERERESTLQNSLYFSLWRIECECFYGSFLITWFVPLILNIWQINITNLEPLVGFDEREREIIVYNTLYFKFRRIMREFFYGIFLITWFVPLMITISKITTDERNKI